MRSAWIVLGCAALAGIVLAGCHHGHDSVVVAYNQPQPQPVIVDQPPPPVIVQQAPPPMIVEQQPPCPEPGFVFIAGYNHWDGHRWGWVHGYWVRPPHPQARWMAPQYPQVGGKYNYVQGHWVGPNGYGHH